jgi:hypothetical protein
MMLIIPDPPDYLNLEEVVGRANEKLRQKGDLKFKVKTGSWRGKDVSFLDFGQGNPTPGSKNWQSFGHLYFPKNGCQYGIDKDFIRCLAEDEDHRRYVLIVWPYFESYPCFESADLSDLPIGVEIDPWYQHRQPKKVEFIQSGNKRSLRATESHLPEVNLDNILEYGYWLFRYRDLLCSNHFRIFQFNKDHQNSDPRALRKQAFKTALWIREYVLTPFLGKLKEIIARERAMDTRGVSITALKATKFCLENTLEPFNIEPYLALYHLASPWDNHDTTIPIFGPGFLEYCFPPAHKLITAQQAELRLETATWDWGLAGVGARKFLEKMLGYLGNDWSSLVRTFTPEFA